MNINIKRFSRSKVDVIDSEDDIQLTKEPEQQAKRGRGRPKKEIKMILPQVEQEVEQEIEQEQEQEILPTFENTDAISELSEPDFLKEMNNVNYKDEEKIIPIKKQKPEPVFTPATRVNVDNIFAKVRNRGFKPAPKIPAKTNNINTIPNNKKSKYEDDNSLFDDKGTEILGRDRRVLISKIQQYKNLFPEELNKFKIKNNCSVQDLQLYLSEMETIVDTSSVESFLSDSIIHCINLVEGLSSYTRYDISGCGELLKGNKQFHTLIKQMYIKYKVFDKTPPEFQLAILVATTAYVCKNQNGKKKDIENFLNQKI